MRRNKWNPEVQISCHSVADLKFKKIIAELGEILYREICSCQLQDPIEAKSTATRSDSSHPEERMVANE
jgi:hypothetical protein